VVEMSTAPVLATHSGVDHFNDIGRNFSDEMLLKLKENNGTIQLIPLDSFIRETPPNPERDAAMAALEEEFGDRRELSAERMQEYMTRRREISRQYPTPPPTMDDYVRHIDYVVNLIGIDHVGFGSDFDGGGGIPDIDDISMLPNLTVELLRRGYSRRDIEKFWGGNLLRVMRDVERVAGR
jgi:membrane dipeptidase